MAQATIDLNALTETYVKRLRRELDLDRVLFLGESYDGIDGRLSDVRFIVISRTFEKMDHITRSRQLGMLGFYVSPAIQAWAFTPKEIARHASSEKYNLFLAQFLPGSREIYSKSPKQSSKRTEEKPHDRE